MTEMQERARGPEELQSIADGSLTGPSRSRQDILRRSCAALVPNTRFVKCREERIKGYTAQFVANDAPRNLDPGPPQGSNAAEKIAFVFLRNCTNFGSGWHPFLDKEKGLSGARTTAFRLSTWLAREGVPSARWLSSVTPEKVSEIFGQAYVSPVAELMNAFASSWQEFGHQLLTRYDGKIETLITAARNSAVTLSELLSAMKLWSDVYTLDGLEFPFLKRAQLTASDLAHFSAEDPRCQFYDLDQLTMFADNLVPHTLKIDGILDFSPTLEKCITRGQLILAGSREEIEIRAMAIHAVELISSECQDQGAMLSPAALSAWIWNKGQSIKYKSHPRHRARTVHY